MNGGGSMVDDVTKQICYRVSQRVYDLLDEVCWGEIAGKRVKIADLSKFAREFMMRGMMVYFEERQMIEKYKAIKEEESK